MVRFLLILIALLAAQASQAQQSTRSETKKAFKRGEKVSYRVHYGVIDAGEATIEVTHETLAFGGVPTYHFVGTGKSVSAFDWFFKVRDRYDSYAEEGSLRPRVFMRRVDEGGFIINQDYVFNHPEKTVKVSRDGTDKPRNAKNKKMTIGEHTHDILSAFYYARNINFDGFKPGDLITVNTFFDEEMFPMQMKFAGREVIKTKAGKIRCILLRPVIQKGRVFKNEEDLSVWISDDPNHLPMRIEAKIVVGSVKMDLKSFENLAHPLALVK